MALEMARLGHEVVVITQTEFQGDIERELAAGTLPANLRLTSLPQAGSNGYGTRA